MSAYPTTTYMGLTPKRSDITGDPNQVFKFDSYLDCWQHQRQYHCGNQDHQLGIPMHSVSLRPSNPLKSFWQAYCIYWAFIQQGSSVQPDQDQHHFHFSFS
jgi:hypothetical protein